ncbi:MAG: GxxExxY protein [Phycisphaerae bacterium]|nr:GxxExxY protein [Phycisphaerae bacterium]
MNTDLELFVQKDEKTYMILGAAMEVHNSLGRGFLENVYQCALAKEFDLRKISFCREVKLPVKYKGQVLDCYYQADFICFEEIIVELKALKQLSGIEEAQVLNYLKATEIKKALLINFGNSKLEFKRLVF